MGLQYKHDKINMPQLNDCRVRLHLWGLAVTLHGSRV